MSHQVVANIAVRQHRVGKRQAGGTRRRGTRRADGAEIDSKVINRAPGGGSVVGRGGRHRASTAEHKVARDSDVRQGDATGTVEDATTETGATASTAGCEGCASVATLGGVLQDGGVECDNGAGIIKNCATEASTTTAAKRVGGAHAPAIATGL